MRKVGMYGGKFVPVHQGHVYAMIKASTMVDELHVIVSYDEEYEKNVLFKNAKIDHIPYRVRLRWWTQLTKDLPHVHVHAVEEKQTGNFSDWEKGAKAIKEVVGKEIDTVFSSEHAYGEFFDKLYPNAKHVVLDANRTQYNISATKIRNEGAVKHWEMLPKIVQPYFVKKVVVVGTESCGKSTLVQNLASIYNTNYVEEYGRLFYERIGNCENVILDSDFPEIGFEHKAQEKREMLNSNKLMFIDTEGIVTQYYSKIYTDKEHEILNDIIKLQDYDLWLFLEPDVKWVNDGTRSFGKQEIREKNNELLKKMLIKHNVEFVSISGNYESRLNKAIELVDAIIRIK